MQSPYNSPIDYRKQLKPDAENTLDSRDAEAFNESSDLLYKILTSDTVKTRSHGEESVSPLPRFPGEEMFSEYPLCPDVVSALLSCDKKNKMYEPRKKSSSPSIPF